MNRILVVQKFSNKELSSICEKNSSWQVSLTQRFVSGKRLVRDLLILSEFSSKLWQASEDKGWVEKEGGKKEWKKKEEKEKRLKYGMSEKEDRQKEKP